MSFNRQGRLPIISLKKGQELRVNITVPAGAIVPAFTVRGGSGVLCKFSDTASRTGRTALFVGQGVGTVSIEDSHYVEPPATYTYREFSVSVG